MSLTFNNRIALVTGAGRGIGKAIADLLAKNGVTVICVSKSADSCGATAAAITAAGGKAKALAVDVADGAAGAQARAGPNAQVGPNHNPVNKPRLTKDHPLVPPSQGGWNAGTATKPNRCIPSEK